LKKNLHIDLSLVKNLRDDADQVSKEIAE